jgi:hypothetical protein
MTLNAVLPIVTFYIVMLGVVMLVVVILSVVVHHLLYNDSFLC